MNKDKIFRLIGLAGLVLTLFGASARVAAQDYQRFDVPGANTPFSQADLQVLVGPIALYADDLVGIVLPASTYPLQIVQASRFLDDLENNPGLQPDPNWDSSVVALLNYPDLLRLLDANIDWTWALGEAVLDQQPAVFDAIQVFRRQALNAGNLASNDQQSVSTNGELIEIAPANPEVIYIPYYEPERVVVVQPRPVIHFYSDPYPLYYYPYPIGYRFHTGFFWGVTSAFHIGWYSRALHVYDYRHRSHPYYGRSYYTPYYARTSVNININLNRRNSVWQPRNYRASRPHRVTNRARVTVSREGARNSPATRRTVTERRTVTQPRVNTTSRNATQTLSPQRSDRTTLQTQQRNNRAAQQRRSNVGAQPTTRQSTPSSRARTSVGNTSNRNTATAAAPRTRQTPTFANPQRQVSGQSAAGSNRISASPQRQSNLAAPARPGQRATSGTTRAAPSRAAPSRAAPSRAAPARAAPSQNGATRQSGNAGRSSNRSGQRSGAGRTRR
jgi:hypothetical protein